MNLLVKQPELPDSQDGFLVAAASARRGSCLQALSIKQGHVRFKNHGVRLIPEPFFLPKIQTLDFIPGDLFLPRLSTLSSEPSYRFGCPVRALNWYLKKTSQVRQSDHLFITTIAPFQAASKDTISKWIIRLISPHSKGHKVRAHDVRGQAASKALFAGVPLGDILKAAAWKTPTTFVSCYLTNTLTAEAAFGTAVLTTPHGHRSDATQPPRRC